MSTTSTAISVVSPVYRCSGCLRRLVDEVHAAVGRTGADLEMILVDDGSPDDAWTAVVELARDRPWLTGLRLSRNFGQHAAISAGLAATTGDWVVVLDCDLQDPPAAIPDLFRHAVDGGYDVVWARRLGRTDGPLKRASSAAFYRVLGGLTGVPLDPATANFGIFGRNVIDAVTAMPERDRAFHLLVRWVGFRQSAIDVPHGIRAEGRSSYTVRALLRFALAIVLGYSRKPLMLVAGIGMACGLLSFGLVGLAIHQYLTGSIAVAGWTSTIASIWLVGGLLLMCLGVVGLYVGQVFTTVQGRPTSIVAEATDPSPRAAGHPHPGLPAPQEPRGRTHAHR